MFSMKADGVFLFQEALSETSCQFINNLCSKRLESIRICNALYRPLRNCNTFSCCSDPLPARCKQPTYSTKAYQISSVLDSRHKWLLDDFPSYTKHNLGIN